MKKGGLLFLIFMAAYIALSQGRPQDVSRGRVDITEPGPLMFLTISSLSWKEKNGTTLERLIELNWYNVPDKILKNPDSWVGLFVENPTEVATADTLSHPLVKIHPKDHPEGYYRTDVTFPRPVFDHIKPVKKCLGYYGAFVSGGRVLASNCLRTNPTWMRDNKEVLGSKTLDQLMIPGTHNSGSYNSYRPEKDTISRKYLYCQDESVWTQLVYGIRYLDLRVSYRTVLSRNESLWISHGLLMTPNPVRDILLQVKEFMDLTNEIVILDFHRFDNGFTGRLAERRHKMLMEMLITELGDYMIPSSFGYTKTLNELWASNKRLLVGYTADQRVESNLLFPAVRHLWGDKDNLKDLEEYLNSVVCLYRFPPLRSAMAELTPTGTGLITDRYGGLRKMAQDVNGYITKWFRERWWHCANIVATDYFMGNDIIDVTIRSNIKRQEY